MPLTAEQVAKLRLYRTASIGPVAFHQLIARFGTAESALAAIPDLAARAGGTAPRISALSEVEREIARTEAAGGRFLFIGEEDYPLLLAQAEGSPPVLVAAGDSALLARPTIAIVGARNASAAACRLARQIALELGAAGVTIVSGLARGIDSAAHDGSLESGTASVIAGGLDTFYPPENEARQREIAERGILLTEQPLGTVPRARHFPLRNRIIAGAALGTLVVEAAPRSGSLITARRAGDFGREVMAIPGSPLDPRAQGCNLLIREGATLIQSAADVIEAVRPLGLVAPVRIVPPLAAAPDVVADEDRARIADLIGPTPVAVDEIIRQARLEPSLVQAVLLELEVAERIVRHAGARVSAA